MLLFMSVILLVSTIMADDARIIKMPNYIVKINDYNTLVSIERAGNESSNELNLTGLGLECIQYDAFGENLSNLEILDLSNNMMENLPMFVFSNLRNLRHLSLADNRLNSIMNAFVGLDNLESLDMTNNSLTHFVANDLFGLKKNCDIKIGGNPIKVIGTGVFLNTTNSALYSTVRNICKNNKKNVSMIINDSRPVMSYHYDDDSNPFLNEDEDYPDEVIAYLNLKPPRNKTVKICFNKDDRLRVVELPKKDEIFPVDCKEIRQIEFSKLTLSLNEIGLKKFEKGWYQLRYKYSIETIKLENNEIAQLSPEIVNDLPANITMVSLAGNKITSLISGTVANERLMELDLSRNLIRNIEADTFEKTNIETLHLDYNQFTTTEFVKNLPTSLKKLSIESNRISEMTADSFEKLIKLKHLQMSNNEIVKIGNNDFRGLASLEFLELHKNGMRSIEPGSFRHVGQLRYLILDDNEISSLERGIFKDLDEIRLLAIRNNKLRKITRESFHGLGDELETLTLSGNLITSLETGTFVGVPKYTLYLADNRIMKISPKTFDLSSLTGLILKGNNLSEINAESFVGLPNVTHLNMDKSNIRKIGKGFGENMPKLDELFLMGNLIESLESGTFINTPKRYLYLNDNRISKIANDTFSLPTLERLDLPKNKLTELHAGQFAGLSRLSDLDLSTNLITKINKGFGNNLVNVYNFNLERNFIKRLENGDLSGFDKSRNWIHNIYLESTPVELIQGGLFDDA